MKQEIFAKFVQLADLLGVEVKTMSMRVFGSGSAVCRIIDCKQIWKMRRKKKKLFFSNFFFLFGFVSERREARNFCKICAACSSFGGRNVVVLTCRSLNFVSQLKLHLYLGW